MTQSRAGSATLGEADSRASSSAWRDASAAAEGRPSSGEDCGEVGSGDGHAGDEERRSSAAFAAATSAECFRHAAFLMIRSSAGPRTRPDGDAPPSGAVGVDMVRGSMRWLSPS